MKAGLIESKSRNRRDPKLRGLDGSYRAGTRPNEQWTVDFKGQFRLCDRSLCYPLTIQDDATGFVLCLDDYNSTGTNGVLPVSIYANAVKAGELEQTAQRQKQISSMRHNVARYLHFSIALRTVILWNRCFAVDLSRAPPRLTKRIPINSIDNAHSFTIFRLGINPP